MARVTTVKAARKDIIVNGETVVKKGETYYHWTLGFRGRKQVSKTYPTKRQLTQSDYRLRIYDLEDERDGISAESPEDLQQQRDDFVQSLTDYKEELEGNLEQVPEQLKDSHVLNERIEALDGVIGELEGIDLDYDCDEIAEDAQAEHLQNWLDEKISEIQEVCFDA